MRLAFVTARFPYPPFNGDSHRAYHQIRELSRDHQISLFSISDAPVSESDYAELAPFCGHIEVIHLPKWRTLWNLGTGLFSRLPLQIHYYKLPQVRQRLDALLKKQHFDVLHATLIRVSPYVWSLQGPPVVVDMIDSITLSLGTRRNQISGPKRLAYELEYRRVRNYEKLAVKHFPASIVISENDRKALNSNRVSIVPNGVDVERYKYAGVEEREPATLLFTGNMGYDPNQQAMLWFASEVWPTLRGKRPDVRLQIAGVNPGERVRSLAQPGNGIEVLGRVPDIIHNLRRATIAVVPMQSGSGMLNKMLEALSVGIPIVATPTANAGVGAVPERDLLIADNASDFANATLRLLEDEAARSSLSQNGRAYVEQNYTWEKHVQKLLSVYKSVYNGESDQ